jgi:hypothetical protein
MVLVGACEQRRLGETENEVAVPHPTILSIFHADLEQGNCQQIILNVEAKDWLGESEVREIMNLIPIGQTEYNWVSTRLADLEFRKNENTIREGEYEELFNECYDYLKELDKKYYNLYKRFVKNYSSSQLNSFYRAVSQKKHMMTSYENSIINKVMHEKRLELISKNPKNTDEFLMSKRFSNLLDTSGFKRTCKVKGVKINEAFSSFKYNLTLFVFRHGFNPGDKGVYNYMVKLLEDIGLLVLTLVKSKSKSDYILALITFLKLRHNGSILMDGTDLVLKYFDKLFCSGVQSGEDIFKSLRNILDNFNELKNCTLFKKIYQLLLFIMSFSLLDKIGLSFDLLRYSKLEQEAIKKKIHLGPDFLYTLFDSVLFVLERGYQCMISGNLSPIFHSGSSYEDWYEKVENLKLNQLKAKSEEAMGITNFNLLNDLDNLIDTGKSIHDHAKRTNDKAKFMVQKQLSDLVLMKANEMTLRAALQTRKAPFSLEIFGGSSIGKSTFVEICFQHYGKLFDLKTDSEFKYVRNSNNPYWDNFKTWMWCCCHDDMSCFLPGSFASGDPSVSETILMNNNVSFDPPRAHLDDKGKTPFMCRLYLATTNTKDLNATAYFSVPLAFQRRFPFVIDLKPKPEFSKENGFMLDSSLLPEIEEGKYPNYWIIYIYKVVPAPNHHYDKRMGQQGKYDLIESFDEINDFLKWYSIEAKKHEEIQTTVLNCTSNMKNIVLCKSCNLSKTDCDCVKVESDEDLSFENDIMETECLLMSFEDIDAGQPIIRPQLTTLNKKWWKQNYCFGMVNLLTMIHIFGYECIEAFSILAVKHAIKIWLVKTILGCIFGQAFVMNLFLFAGMTSHAFKTLGNLVEKKYYKPIKFVAGMAAIFCSLLAAYRCFQTLSATFCDTVEPTKKKKKNKSFGLNWQANDSGDEFKELHEMGSAPEKQKGDCRKDYYYNKSVEITPNDVSRYSISLNGLDLNQLDKLLQRHCVSVIIYRELDNKEFSESKIKSRAVTIGGHFLLLNNHSIPKGKFKMQIIFEATKMGVTKNLEVYITPTQIVRGPNDIALIYVPNIPPFRNIIPLFAKKP